MQYSLLALSFSLGVMAMPGQVLPRTKTPPSKTTAAAATTTTSDPIADRSSRRAEASLLCNPNGMDSESWVSNDMDYWISFL